MFNTEPKMVAIPSIVTQQKLVTEVTAELINIFKDNAEVQKQRAETYKEYAELLVQRVETLEKSLAESKAEYTAFSEKTAQQADDYCKSVKADFDNKLNEIECERENYRRSVKAEYDEMFNTLSEECEQRVETERKLKEKLIEGSNLMDDRCSFILAKFTELANLYNSFIYRVDFEGKDELCNKINSVIGNVNNATINIAEFTRVLNDVKNGVITNE